MLPKKLVKISNIIGIISILLLIYWIFVFASTEILGLKVFKKNMTETFYMSILIILALLFGALMVNIMFNLTRIAQKHNNDTRPIKTKKYKITIALFILSFPLILGLLAGGNYLTSKKKKQLLINSAESIVNDHIDKTKELVNYNFSKNWINNTSNILKILSETDVYFPDVSIIVRDTIENISLFLNFTSYSYESKTDTLAPNKLNYVLKTTNEERDYFNTIFNTKKYKLKFNYQHGNYDLFYPYIKENKVIIFHFSDYQRYGKIGS